jgi:putative tryptophan/tyrosine transport system substrate-binding protein
VRRRDVITLITGAASGWPLGASAQQPELPVVGYLGATSGGPGPAFRRGLSEAGFVEGRNVAIEYRWAQGEYDRLPALAADLVARRVTVIFSSSITSTLAAKAATSTIPIVFDVGVDPVAFGLVTSLSHPGGNLTGVAFLLGELWPKRLQLLHELVPKAGTIGVLVNPANSNSGANTRNLEPAAKALGLQLEVLPASAELDIEAAFATIQQRRVDALLVGDDPFFNSRSSQLPAMAAAHRVPTIYFAGEFAASGGLISYGPSFTAMARVAGEYTGRILKGTKPADLPVEQPTRFELVVNLKTAAALGLTVPPSILARADEVIE